MVVVGVLFFVVVVGVGGGWWCLEFGVWVLGVVVVGVCGFW